MSGKRNLQGPVGFCQERQQGGNSRQRHENKLDDREFGELKAQQVCKLGL